jgi:hypothetical protein
MPTASDLWLQRAIVWQREQVALGSIGYIAKADFTRNFVSSADLRVQEQITAWARCATGEFQVSSEDI